MFEGCVSLEEKRGGKKVPVAGQLAGHPVKCPVTNCAGINFFFHCGLFQVPPPHASIQPLLHTTTNHTLAKTAQNFLRSSLHFARFYEVSSQCIIHLHCGCFGLRPIPLPFPFFPCLQFPRVVEGRRGSSSAAKTNPGRRTSHAISRHRPIRSLQPADSCYLR